MFQWTLGQIKTVLDLRIERMRQQGTGEATHSGTLGDLKAFFG